MKHVWFPAARKRWDVMFASYGTFEGVAALIDEEEHSHMRAELLGEKHDFSPAIAFAFDGAWKALGQMTSENTPCATTSGLKSYWDEASELTGIASILNALEIGVPSEDVLEGMSDVPEKWHIGNLNEGSFTL